MTHALAKMILDNADLDVDTLLQIADDIREVADERKQAEVPGYWSTTDECGNIDGQYATREQALEEGPGQYPHYVEIEEDDEEAMEEWRQMREAEKANPFKARTAW